MDTICINCPMGCSLHIEEKNGLIIVAGNTCKRGEIYGKEEYILPKRTLTTLVKLKNGSVASCKTSSPIPKDLIFDAIKVIEKLVVNDDVKIGDVVLKNILNLDVNIVITGRNI